jgi:hypothetical protein
MKTRQVSADEYHRAASAYHGIRALAALVYSLVYLSATLVFDGELFSIRRRSSGSFCNAHLALDSRREADQSLGLSEMWRFLPEQTVVDVSPEDLPALQKEVTVMGRLKWRFPLLPV